MSSRNARLTPGGRAAAPVLRRALLAGAARVRAGERSGAAVRDAMLAVLAAEPAATPDYVSVADPDTLAELDDVAGRALLSLAVADRRGPPHRQRAGVLTATQTDVEAFFAGSPLGLAVHARVVELLAPLGEPVVRVTRTQVAYRRRVSFAWTWLPGTWLRTPMESSSCRWRSRTTIRRPAGRRSFTRRHAGGCTTWRSARPATWTTRLAPGSPRPGTPPSDAAGRQGAWRSPGGPPVGKLRLSPGRRRGRSAGRRPIAAQTITAPAAAITPPTGYTAHSPPIAATCPATIAPAMVPTRRPRSRTGPGPSPAGARARAPPRSSSSPPSPARTRCRPAR